MLVPSILPAYGFIDYAWTGCLTRLAWMHGFQGFWMDPRPEVMWPMDSYSAMNLLKKI